IRRVADEDDPVAVMVEIDAVGLAEQPQGHLALVPIAEPAVDMDRAELGRGAAGTHQRDDPIDVVRWQRTGILGNIDRQVGRATDLRARHRPPRSAFRRWSAYRRYPAIRSGLRFVEPRGIR